MEEIGMNIFCEHCRETVEIVTNTVSKSSIIKDKKYEYEGTDAVCMECNNPIFVPQIHDYNLAQLDLAFRNEENIITVDEIKGVLEKYSIGKRPLSSLLGWGEITLTRYLDGSIPTKQYSEILKKIFTDAKYFYEILEQNKGKIAEATYEKVREKTLSEIGIVNFESKIEQVVQYLIIKCEDITPLALQKLLYYSQSFHKAFHGVFLFEDDCEAWVHGPVYKEVYWKYKHYGYNTIGVPEFAIENSTISDIEKETIDRVIHNFGCYSGKILEMMTHVESPWIETRGDLPFNAPCNKVIDKSLLEKYFTDIKQKFKMLNLADIKDYSINLFDKVYN